MSCLRIHLFWKFPVSGVTDCVLLCLVLTEHEVVLEVQPCCRVSPLSCLWPSDSAGVCEAGHRSQALVRPLVFILGGANGRPVPRQEAVGVCRQSGSLDLCHTCCCLAAGDHGAASVCAAWEEGELGRASRATCRPWPQLWASLVCGDGAFPVKSRRVLAVSLIVVSCVPPCHPSSLGG